MCLVVEQDCLVFTVCKASETKTKEGVEEVRRKGLLEQRNWLVALTVFQTQELNDKPQGN